MVNVASAPTTGSWRFRLGIKIGERLNVSAATVLKALAAQASSASSSA